MPSETHTIKKGKKKEKRQQNLFDSFTMSKEHERILLHANNSQASNQPSILLGSFKFDGAVYIVTIESRPYGALDN